MTWCATFNATQKAVGLLAVFDKASVGNSMPGTEGTDISAWTRTGALLRWFAQKGKSVANPLAHGVRDYAAAHDRGSHCFGAR